MATARHHMTPHLPRNPMYLNELRHLPQPSGVDHSYRNQQEE